jgi:hypothetical protein
MYSTSTTIVSDCWWYKARLAHRNQGRQSANTQGNTRQIASKECWKRQHKVIVVGDSHARGCATEVNQLLKNDCEVLRLVNPGCGMECIKDTAKVKLQQLSKEDVLVLWGVGGGLQWHSEKQLYSGYETSVRFSNKRDAHQCNCDECTTLTWLNEHLMCQ